MPPKKGKVEAPKKTLVLGRAGTSLQMGIVGLPNVGKSTFFNLVTQQGIPAENFPFCTIEPNQARVEVQDERYDWLVDLYKPKSRDCRAWLQITDIAGLVKGANEGQGLGNAFLSHIAATDGLFMMVRCFDEEDITHVEGEVDPLRDIDIITDELRKKDQEWVNVKYDALKQAVVQRGMKDKKKEYEAMTKVKACLDEGKVIRLGEWTQDDIVYINTLNLLTAKPCIWLANLSEHDFIRKKNKWLGKVKAHLDERFPGEILIPFSASFEQKVQEMSADDAKAFVEEVKAQSQLQKIIRTGFSALNLCYFFTAGEDEVKAWIIRKGDLAPVAAGKIHTDFEKGFICAEVMHYEDLKEQGSEAACKASGKFRQQGRTYEVLDGDIVLFKFNAGAGMKGCKK